MVKKITSLEKHIVFQQEGSDKEGRPLTSPSGSDLNPYEYNPAPGWPQEATRKV
jgi:hypothetical protein